MDKDKWLKQCSASTTDVEAATQKSKREESDDDDSVKVILKKQRQEIAEMNRSLKDMSGFIKKNSLQKSDLEDILLKVKETPNNKVEPINGPCCFEVEGAEVNNPDTIFVSGFDCSLSRDDIKSKLKKHFRSCGVLRVFVPIQCQTGYPLGFAFLNLRAKHEKALALNGSFLGGLKLVVAMAREREENSDYPDFDGCDRCTMAFHQRLFTSFIKTSGGRLFHWKPKFDISRLGPRESFKEPFDEDSEYEDSE